MSVETTTYFQEQPAITHAGKICAECGALVHREKLAIHIIWHQRVAWLAEQLRAPEGGEH